MKKIIKLSDPLISQKASSSQKQEVASSGCQPAYNNPFNIAGTTRGLVTPDQFLSLNRLALTNPVNLAESPSALTMSKSALRRIKAKSKLEARTESANIATPSFAGFNSRNSYAMEISPPNTMFAETGKIFY